MAFDPVQEDYEHMVLRFCQSQASSSISEAAQKLQDFGTRYAKERDSLPQRDSDRAFHLVSEAALIIDYRLPFAADNAVNDLVTKAQKLLSEALVLDPGNLDAKRMLAAAQSNTFEGYYRYLLEHEAEAKATSEKMAEEAKIATSEEERSLICRLALAPYLRWIAAEADRALICGHYRQSVEFAKTAIRLDPSDEAGAHLTAAYALAKLEDANGFTDLLEYVQHESLPRSAWLDIANFSIDFRLGFIDEARVGLRHILERYPEADTILIQQRELPDGVYSRLPVETGSEDELILAVSEAAVLLQEGRDSQERGTLASWIASEVPALQAQTGRRGTLSHQGQKGDGR